MAPRVLMLGEIQNDFTGKSIDRRFEPADQEGIQNVIYIGDRYTKKKFFRAFQQT